MISSHFPFRGRSLVVFVLALGLFFHAQDAFTGATATQTVSMEVVAINEISVTGTPTLVVDTATAGNQPNVDTDASSTYSITTNETKKITGKIDSAMPANTSLKVTLQAVTGGTSNADVVLGTTDATLETGIDKVAEAGKTVTYKLTAQTTAGVVAAFNRTVTLTIAAP